MASDSPLRSDEIESLLKQTAPGGSSPAPGSAPPKAATPANPALDPKELEALLNKAPAASGASTKTSSARVAAPPSVEPMIQAGDVELLLQQAEAAIRSIDEPNRNLPGGLKSFTLNELGGTPPNQESATIQLLRDVELDLKIELGRTHMYLEDVLKLRKGSVVPLDKLAGDPVEIYANGRLIARGEVLVLNDNFCVRVAELITAETAAAG